MADIDAGLFGSQRQLDGVFIGQTAIVCAFRCFVDLVAETAEVASWSDVIALGIGKYNTESRRKGDGILNLILKLFCDDGPKLKFSH